MKSMIRFMLGLMIVCGASSWARADESVEAGSKLPTTDLNRDSSPVSSSDWNVLLDTFVSTGSYFDWGQARNGWGYCYQWASNGAVLNNGTPVSTYYCESRRPSYFQWSRGRDGWGYCYQWTPYGVAMNEGSPVANYNCEARSPSYYAWAQSQNGYTYCYQWANGIALNQGNPVPNYYCR